MESIILYGAGIYAEKFYAQNKGDVNIEFVIDRSVENFHNIPIYNFEEAKGRLRGKQIIVTMTKSNYISVKKELIQLGLIEFDDFIWVKYFNKKLALLYGNCHMLPIKNYLEMQPEFARIYEIIYYRIGNEEEEEYPSSKVVDRCDLFVTQDIRENNSRHVPGYKELLKSIRSEIKVIIVPNLYGVNLFFPQFHKNENTDMTIRKHIENSRCFTGDTREIFNALSYGNDENIERMYLEGKSRQEIIDKLCDDSLYDEDRIKDMFIKGINKILDRERECTIQISKWILDNYQEKQLFYEPYHPTNVLLEEMAKQCMHQLNLEIYDIVRTPGGMDSREVFIYNSVKKALGLRFQQKYIRNYTRYGTLEDEALNLEGYVDYYIKWML